jgi:hypothetical protein
MTLNESEIAPLAPDAAALQAGKALANIAKWIAIARMEGALWGSIKGSGAKPYKVAVDLTGMRYKCSCPSRKFPCKHALGLMLLSARMGGSMPQAEPEAWVSEWLQKQRGVAQNVPSEPDIDPEKAEKSAQAKVKRQESRNLNALAGAAEMELWLTDLIRGGLLRLPELEVGFFSKGMARMTDAQVSGLGGLIRELRDLDYTNPTVWQPAALEIVSRAWLLSRAIQQLDQWPDALQDDIRSLAGFGAAPRDVLADPDALLIHDTWMTVLIEHQQLDELTAQYNWLIGCTTGQVALVLQFHYKFNAPEVIFVQGRSIQAELAFFPSTVPLRALLKSPVPIHGPAQPLQHTISGWEAAQHQLTQVVAKNPWTSRILLVMSILKPVCMDEQWWLYDNNNKAVPLSMNLDSHITLQMLAQTGGHATDMIVWYDGQYAVPVAYLR